MSVEKMSDFLGNAHVNIEAAAELVERQAREKAEAAQSVQEITLDESNKISFPGYPYTFEACGEQIIVAIDLFKDGNECKGCKGKGKIEVKHPNRVSSFQECDVCKGRGRLIILLDESKKLPPHGVVVSIGNLVPPEKITWKRGDRVLFGEHAGSMIPTKAGLMFKYMDWYAVKLKIEGASELDAFDFIVTEND